MENDNGAVTRALSLAAAGGTAHDPWITTLATVLAEVDAAEAAWKPDGVERSIGEIAEHVRAWTGWVVGFLAGHDTDVVNWPEPSDWDASRARLQETLAAFQSAVDGLTDAQLLESPTPTATSTNRLTGVLSIAIHNAHHAGQLTKLHEAYRRSH